MVWDLCFVVLPTQLEDGQSNPAIEDLENLLANEENLVKQITGV